MNRALPAGIVATVEAACAERQPEPREVVAILRQLPPYTHRAIADVASITGYAYGTVSALRWLAARVPASVQRDDLSLRHHFAVARLAPAEQRRRLAEAAAEKLSSDALRERIAKAAL
ncbi:MAG TPA: hypothetical protein VJU14_10835 [Solirubrobacterales bacterium]|nr:hypothetical protein [Solirubrobacterales bacterium]